MAIIGKLIIPMSHSFRKSDGIIMTLWLHIEMKKNKFTLGN